MTMYQKILITIILTATIYCFFAFFIPLSLINARKWSGPVLSNSIKISNLLTPIVGLSIVGYFFYTAQKNRRLFLQCIEQDIANGFCTHNTLSLAQKIPLSWFGQLKEIEIIEAFEQSNFLSHTVEYLPSQYLIVKTLRRIS
jgi:hypothetical protein